MHRLASPALLDPRWFQQMRSSKWQDATVINAETVEVLGQTLRIANPEEIMLEPGQVAYAILTDHFYLETQQEQRTRIEEISKRIDREKREERDRQDRRRVEAEAFNAMLHIPVLWKSGMKDVLSGLSETSNGTGMNAVTVTHVWLQEALHDGRLHREQFDFLCTSARGSNGKQWSGQTEDWREDGYRNHYQAQVTCKHCLQIAERWRVKA